MRPQRRVTDHHGPEAGRLALVNLRARFPVAFDLLNVGPCVHGVRCATCARAAVCMVDGAPICFPAAEGALDDVEPDPPSGNEVSP